MVGGFVVVVCFGAIYVCFVVAGVFFLN